MPIPYILIIQDFDKTSKGSIALAPVLKMTNTALFEFDIIMGNNSTWTTYYHMESKEMREADWSATKPLLDFLLDDQGQSSFAEIQTYSGHKTWPKNYIYTCLHLDACRVKHQV